MRARSLDRNVDNLGFGASWIVKLEAYNLNGFINSISLI